LLLTLAANVVALTAKGAGGFALLAPLSIPIVVGAGNSVLVHFSASGANPGGGSQTFFRLVLDGAVGAPIKKSTFTRGGGGGPGGESTAIVAKITGLVGLHLLEIWWDASAGLTTIDPVGAEHHATLLVEEVSV
jgi:hypothetical protein